MNAMMTPKAEDRSIPNDKDHYIGADFFVDGGTLSLKAPSYVKRSTDDELLEHLLRGEFCFVLTPRQMGKSSLMYRTADRLEKEGVRTVKIDLNAIGSMALDVDQWYLGLLHQIRRTLKLPVDEGVWWDERKALSNVVRFLEFLEEVLLGYIKSRVVIFIDEIDYTLKLSFRDDFFAAIRAVYNHRSDRTAFHRLTFAMLGVAAPTDLIKDKTITPFNIGYGIALKEFSLEDADVLLQGLKALHPLQGEQIFRRIYEWTNGHPYLTQRLCKAVAEEPQKDWNDTEVDRLVERLFLKEEARKTDNNLQFVQDRILSSSLRSQLLSIYRKVISGRTVHDDGQSIVQSQLKLSGLVEVENGQLQVRNRIYQRAFDRTWVHKNMPTPWPTVATVASVLLALIMVGLLFYDGVYLPSQVDKLLKEFSQSNQPSERGTYLAKVIRMRGIVLRNDHDYKAINKFYSLLRDEQIALFPDKDCQQNDPQDAVYLILEVSKTLADVEETSETTPLLDVMVNHLNCLKKQSDTTNLGMVKDLYTMLYNWQRGRKLALEPSTMESAALLYGQALAVNEKLSQPDQTNPSLLYEHARLLTRIYARELTSGQLSNTQFYETALKDLDQIWAISVSRPIPTSTPSPISSPITPTDSKTDNPVTPSSRPTNTPPPGQGTHVTQYFETPIAQETQTATVMEGPQKTRTTEKIPTVELTPTEAQIPLPDRFYSKFRTSDDWQYWVRKLLNDNDWLQQVLSQFSRERFPNLYKAGLYFSPTATPVITKTPTSYVSSTLSQELSLEPNTDRPGMDYLSRTAKDVKGCSELCLKDENCQAFTFHERAGKCILKSGIPSPVFDSCCTSGARRISATTTLSVSTSMPVKAVQLAVLPAPVSLFSIQYSLNGDRLVTAGDDGTAQIWSIENHMVEVLLFGHTAQVNQARFSPDGSKVVTASNDGTARVWDAMSGEELLRLKGHTGIDYEPYIVYEATFSPDGKEILTAGGDGTAITWDASTGKQLSRLYGHENQVVSASYSPDGRYIATASWDSTARLWDAKTGNQILYFIGHEDFVNCVSFSPDGKKLVTASNDLTIRLWGVEKGQELSQFRGHTDFVQTANFSPDGRYIVSASWDNTARIWDTGKGDQIIVLAGHEDRVESASFSPDGRWLVTASSDGTGRIWDAPSGEPHWVLPGQIVQLFSAGFSQDGFAVVSAGMNPQVHVWDLLNNWTLKYKYYEDAPGIGDVTFSPDGSRLAIGGSDGTVHVREAESGIGLLNLEGHTGIVWAVDFNSDGTRLATAGVDGMVRLWEMSRGFALLEFNGQSGSLRDVAFSPDGSLIVTAGEDGTARVWDTASGQERLTLTGHEGRVLSANFSPDGSLIATTGSDGTARIWDVASGHELVAVLGHEGWVRSSGFSPDGRFLITSGQDSTVRIWDVASGRELLKFTVSNPGAGQSFVFGVAWAAFSPDGQRLVTADLYGQTTLWELVFISMEIAQPQLMPTP